MKIIITSLIVAAILGCVVALFIAADIRTKQLIRLSDCVAEKAQEEGYAGNPYSEDAWLLFADSCNKK